MRRDSSASAVRTWVHDAVDASLRAFTDMMVGIDADAVVRVTERLRVARDDQRTVFIAGNGGSASTATHWVNDLCKAATTSGRTPIRALSLTDNVSWMTALANDVGYEHVFVGQLENFAQTNDVLIVISASGNSPNLVRAVEFAKERHLITIGLLGFDGGLLLRSDLTEAVWLETPVGAYGIVETGHSLVADVITSCLMQDTNTSNGSVVQQ